jgi:hypothetical protein
MRGNTHGVADLRKIAKEKSLVNCPTVLTPLGVGWATGHPSCCGFGSGQPRPVALVGGLSLHPCPPFFLNQ